MGRPATTVTWEGETVRLDRLAYKHGINVFTVKARMEAGMPLEQALTAPVSITITVKSGESGSISYWAKKTGLSYQVIRGRYVSCGWTADQSVGLDPPPRKRAADYPEIEIDGEKIRLDDLARKHGLTPPVIYYRIKSGWPPEQVLMAETKTMLTTSDGESHSMSEWAEITGIKPGTLTNRQREGWDPDEIVGKKKRVTKRRWGQYRKPLTTSSGETRTLTEWSEFLSIPMSTLLERTRRGHLTPDQVLGLEPVPRRIPMKRRQAR